MHRTSMDMGGFAGTRLAPVMEEAIGQCDIYFFYVGRKVNELGLYIYYWP
jgi:hypothetical protein